MRRVRFLPEGHSLVEVTCRTIHGRPLLQPSPELNEIILGVLGRAQKRYSVGICGFSFLSTHYHLVLVVKDVRQLSDFMEHFNGKLAKEVGRLVDWKDKVWARRYQAIPISNEEAAQVERFEYVLANGVKEGLVAQVRDWPGVHCVRALLEGEKLEGYWFDRTKEYAARQRRQPYQRLTYAEKESVELQPLPCWEHLSKEEYRQCVADLVKGIEARAREERGSNEEVRPLEAKHPHERPARLKKSPAPLFHAASREMRKQLYQMYKAFVGLFREASEKMKLGDRLAIFPPGSFPPHLPFVSG
jgi:REP element-mobilizing transposase RayT